MASVGFEPGTFSIETCILNDHSYRALHMYVAYFKCLLQVCTIEWSMVNIGEGDLYVTCMKGFDYNLCLLLGARAIHTVLWQLYIENQKHIPKFCIYDALFIDKQLSIWRIVQN